MISKAALAAFFCLAASVAWAQSAVTPGGDKAVSIAPTVQNAAYSASNSLGGLQTLSAFRLSAHSGIFNRLWLGSKGGSTVAMTVYVFDANPTNSTCTDKTAFSLASADLAKLAFAPFVITPAAPQGATQTVGEFSTVASLANADSPQTTNIYLCIVANASVTPASTSDIVGALLLSQNN